MSEKGSGTTFWIVIAVIGVVCWAFVTLPRWYQKSYGTAAQKAQVARQEAVEEAGRAAGRERVQAIRQAREQAEFEKKVRAIDEQRERWERECADKGLRFTGTIDGKVECRP